MTSNTTTSGAKRQCAGCPAVIVAGRSDRLYCSQRCRRGAQKRRQRGDSSSPPTGFVPSVIRGSNGKLIAKVARLGYLGDDTTPVLDVTPGREKWWTIYRPPGLVTRSGEDFRAMSDADASWRGVIAFDPPYISTGSRATSSIDEFYDRYGLGEVKGWRDVRRQIEEGLTEQARIMAPRSTLLLKCMDYVESGAKRFNSIHFGAFGDQLDLTLVERFHHLTGGGAQPKTNLDGSPREQKHAREVTSTLLVFTKRAIPTRRDGL